MDLRGCAAAKNKFSEYGHAAYQINGNEKYNNMLANSLPLDTPSTPGVGSKGQLVFSFLKVELLHIKLKVMKLRTPCRQMFCTFTPGVG